MKQITITMLALFAIIGMVFAEQNYVKPAGKVVYSNSGAAISAGDVVDLGDQYAVARVDIASNGTGVVVTEGIYDFTLATNETITVGDKLYWDSTNEQVTETATADKFIGTAVEAVTTTTATDIIQTWLNPGLRDTVVGVDVQAYDADLSAIAALAKADGNVIVGNGTAWVAESAATARTSLGLGSGISTNYSAVTNFDITIVNGVITVFTAN